jgi:EAL domain-containing protein (putative c-di-GMP-specific phosphodiesterase class I)
MFGRRRVRPCACVIDRKQHIRTFLCDTLEELGFITCECGQLDELNTALNAHCPDLIVLGVSAGGQECGAILKALAAKQFAGNLLLLGARASRVLESVHQLGEKLGLAMLPALPTPFGSANLRDSVATLLPVEPRLLPSIDVGEAISGGWLELWYQPKIDAHTLAVTGAEALIRMRHPTWGIVTPGYFIPDDRDPRFGALSQFVIDQSVRDWHDFVAYCGPIEIAINLPMVFFQRPDAIRELAEKLPSHPAFEGLIVEINAFEIIRSLPLAKSVARQLRFHNIGISIDDIGMEWPSLTGLSDFPFLELKVDHRFVTGCADNPSMQAVCRGIIDLSKAYGVRAVAEGVETTADLLAVREMGADLVQGFLFAKPMGAKKFSEIQRAAAARKAAQCELLTHSKP